MRSRIRWFRRLAISLIAVLSACPYLIGWFIERQVNGLQPYSGIQIKHFERGWLSSKAISTVELPAQPLQLQHRIEHGPVPLDWLQPAAASLQTVLADSECLKLGVKCDPSRPPALDSLLYWNGASQHRAHIASLLAPIFSLHELNAELQLPSLANPKSAYAAGDFGDLSAELQVQAERLIYTALALEELQGDLQLNGAGNLIDARSQWHAKTLLWHDQRWSELNLSFRAERLDVILLLSFLNKQWSPEQLLALQDWLQKNPVLNMEQLTLNDGRLTAHGDARLRPVNFLRLLRRLDLPGILAAALADAHLELRAERALAEQLLALWLRGELNDSSLQQARQRLQEWSQADFVRLQNNHYHAHLSFENNQFISH